MKNQNLLDRTKSFAHNCVKLALELPSNKIGNHIQGQLIRCSTSVAANYRATNLAQTKPSFIAKLSIVLEEADESAFWLEFIRDEEVIKTEEVFELLKEAKELRQYLYHQEKQLKATQDIYDNLITIH